MVGHELRTPITVVLGMAQGGGARLVAELPDQGPV
jgi:signal transduction histidine kinase